MPTVLYTEKNYPDDSVERRIYGSDVRVIFPPTPTTGLADLSDEDCAAAEGLMILRYKVTAKDLERFPRLRAICRMGVGYDNLDRVAANGRQIMILNVPDYGTTEVADHAMSLALALRPALGKTKVILQIAYHLHQYRRQQRQQGQAPGQRRMLVIGQRNPQQHRPQRQRQTGRARSHTPRGPGTGAHRIFNLHRTNSL